MCICQTRSFGVWKWELEKFKNVKMFLLLFFIIYYEVLIVISDFNNNNEKIPPSKKFGKQTENQKPWYNLCFESIYTSKFLSEEWL